MPIRQATASDIPHIADIFAASFAEDDLFKILFPHRHEYYADYVGALRRRTRESYWDYKKVFMVAYEIEGEGEGDGVGETAALLTKGRKGKEVLVGLAEWERAGEGWEGLWGIWGRWDPRLLIKPLLQLSHKIYTTFIPERASAIPTPSDPNPLTLDNFLPALGPFIGHFFTDPPHRRIHWELAALGVHPNYQQRQHGRELVAWGLERAKAEGLPSVVVAAKGRERFYQRCGFGILVGWASEGVDAQGNRNPLGARGVGGSAILWSRVKEDGNADAEGEGEV